MPVHWIVPASLKRSHSTEFFCSTRKHSPQVKVTNLVLRLRRVLAFKVHFSPKIFLRITARLKSSASNSLLNLRGGERHLLSRKLRRLSLAKLCQCINRNRTHQEYGRKTEQARKPILFRRLGLIEKRVCAQIFKVRLRQCFVQSKDRFFA